VRGTDEVATVAKQASLEDRLGVRFQNPALLEQALVHSSYVNENPQLRLQSNERLEFLGDAVLGLVVADELFASYADMDEGKLTEMRAHLVRRDTLAKAARRLRLGNDLQLGRGEEGGGGRARPTNLAHAYEAVVGAIFLDGGLEAARGFVTRSLSAEIETAGERAFPGDSKSRLQEQSQARYQTTPQYRLVKAEGPDHARRFTIEVLIAGEVWGRGRGRSKQDAEKQAARRALERMEAQSNDDPAGTQNPCT
jgi:ribonuclease-3